MRDSQQGQSVLPAILVAMLLAVVIVIVSQQGVKALADALFARGW